MYPDYKFKTNQLFFNKNDINLIQLMYGKPNETEKKMRNRFKFMGIKS